MSKLGLRSAAYSDIVHRDGGQTENLSAAPLPTSCSGKPIITQTFHLPANKKLCVENLWQEYFMNNNHCKNPTTEV